MKYRSRMDIVAAMLRSMVERKVTKSRVMYAGYLSYAQVKEYLPYLEDRGLIERDGESLYGLTERGFEVLRLYDRISDVIGTQSVRGGSVEGRNEPSWLRVRVPESSSSREFY